MKSNFKVWLCSMHSQGIGFRKVGILAGFVLCFWKHRIWGRLFSLALNNCINQLARPTSASIRVARSNNTCVYADVVVIRVHA